MGFYGNNPNTHVEYNFIEIPEGKHRVQICNVKVERFKFEKKCFEITLKVSGHHNKLWYYIWYNPEYPDRTNREFAMFFDSFQIQDFEIKNYKKWIGSSGAVYVEYSRNILKYNYTAMVKYCLTGVDRDSLPAWQDAPTDDVPVCFREPLF